jgi:hypothetical protein
MVLEKYPWLTALDGGIFGKWNVKLKGKMDSERRFFGAEVQTEVLHMLYN